MKRTARLSRTNAKTVDVDKVGKLLRVLSSDKEGEVLALIAEGFSNGEIAGRLFVSEATIKTHVNHIFAKTHSRDRAQAVAYAHRAGIAGRRP